MEIHTGDIPIELPTRICIIGASSTGKTELIKRMIIRGDFGNKRELEVMVLSPSPITLVAESVEIARGNGCKDEQGIDE